MFSTKTYQTRACEGGTGRKCIHPELQAADCWVARRQALFALAISPSLASSERAKAESSRASDVPSYLAMARELVDNIKPNDNEYRLGHQFISFPGDVGSDRYAMRADCSGFLLAIFERAKMPVRPKMIFLVAGAQRTRPTSEDFVLSIEKEKGFKLIRKIEDVKAGDLLAHAMLDKEVQKQTGTTGHVFLIDSQAKAVTSKPPIVKGTTQFEVSVIDSNEEHVGADDSRLAGSKKMTGLGKGTIRIFADTNGELVGWARTFRDANQFFSYNPNFPSNTKRRKAAIGRPNARN